MCLCLCVRWGELFVCVHVCMYVHACMHSCIYIFPYYLFLFCFTVNIKVIPNKGNSLKMVLSVAMLLCSDDYK